MSHTILTPTAVTRAAAVILHEEGKLLRRVNRQFDKSASVSDGRKTGGSIKIRMPNQYTVRRTWTMNAQDVEEKSETLTIGQVFGVDLQFTDDELSLKIEDFGDRILRPAVRRLVADIEAYFYADFVNSIGNCIDNDAAAMSFLNVMQARQRLVENLAPDDDNDLSLALSPTHNTKLVDALKGLFVPGQTLGSQYKSGMMLPVAGVGSVFVSTHATNLLTGTNSKGDTTYDTDIAAAEVSGTDGALGINIDTGSGTFKAGEIFEIESVNAVHPETKADLGYRKQFAVLADAAGGANTELKFYPISGGDAGIVASGARQNVSAAPADGKIIYKVGAGNAELLNRSLYFHRDAYAVAFAKLQDPAKFGAWGASETVDDINVRIWRDRDITNSQFPIRLDVYCGGKTIRPELACRIHADG